MGPQIAQLMYAAAVLGSIVYAVRRGPLALLYAHLFFLPWFGLQANLGLTLNVDRILAAALIGFLLVHRRRGSFVGYGWLLAYLVANTVLQGLALPESARDYPPLQGEWRWLFQLIMWSLMILPGAVIAATGAPEVVRRCMRVVVASCSILAAIAIAQYAFQYATGIDLLPVGMFEASEDARRSGAFEVDRSFALGSQVFRASSFGGEPKHLAYSLLLALSLLVAEWAYGGVMGLRQRTLWAATLLCGTALVLTFSTQGLVLAVLNTGFIAGLAVLQGRASLARGGKMVVLGTFVVAALALVPGLLSVLGLRTVDRLRETGGLEDWNIAVFDWLYANPDALPFGVGLGNVHLYAAAFIPTEYLYYMAGRVFVAKSGLLRLVSEAGIVGLSLFLAAYLRPLRRLFAGERQRDSMSVAAAVVGIVTLLNFLVTADGPIYIFIVGGMCLALERHQRLPGRSALAITERKSQGRSA